MEHSMVDLDKACFAPDPLYNVVVYSSLPSGYSVDARWSFVSCRSFASLLLVAALVHATLFTWYVHMVRSFYYSSWQWYSRHCQAPVWTTLAFQVVAGRERVEPSTHLFS